MLKAINITKFIKQTYRFSTRKVYKPLIPLLQKYNTIYSHPEYVTGQYYQGKSIFYYEIPAALMAINNYLTQWNKVTSVIFVLLLFGGIAANVNVNEYQSLKIKCIQTDDNLDNFYLVLNRGAKTHILRNEFPISNQQKQELVQSYHPVKTKTNDPNASTKHASKNVSSQFLKQLGATPIVELGISRIKLTKQDAKFEIQLQKNQILQYQRDLQRLQPRQMMKKYENRAIYLNIVEPDSQKVELRLYPEEGVNKRYHDYLLALAFGYQIDLSSKFTYKAENNKQKNDQKNEQKEQKQEQKNEQKNEQMNK